MGAKHDTADGKGRGSDVPSDMKDGAEGAPAVGPGPDAAAALAELHRARALAELAHADQLAPGSDAVAWRGEVLATVFVVKGAPGPAESGGGAAVSGPDADAAEKVFEALGYDPGDVFYTLSRPEPGIDADVRAGRLAAQIEAVDPEVVIALDPVAAEDLAHALGLRVIPSGKALRVLGRRVVAADGLEASLDDEALKKRVWRQLQAARKPGPIY